MDLGMIGLGKMGANMSERLLAGGHRVIAFDSNADALQRVVDKGAVASGSLEELVAALEPKRNIWMMVPAGDPVQSSIDEEPFMSADGALNVRAWAGSSTCDAL